MVHFGMAWKCNGDSINARGWP